MRSASYLWLRPTALKYARPTNAMSGMPYEYSIVTKITV